MTRRYSLPLRDNQQRLGAALCLTIALLTGGASPARADDPAVARITRLNKQALDAFDNLNFDQARSVLEQALSESEAAGLSRDPVAARSHLNLGLVLIAGFQQHDPAIEQFKSALRLLPDITAPAGLFNPEVQAAFDEAKASIKAEPAPPTPPAARPSARPGSAATTPESSTTGSNRGQAKSGGQGQGQGEGEDTDKSEGDETPGTVGPPTKFLLTLGFGSGFGIAKGHLDANRGSVQDDSWSGSLAPSSLGHILVGAGYFISPHLMLSLEGRVQIISGTTVVKGTAACMTPCSPPSTAVAVMAKANWFLSNGPLRPFVNAGLGVGNIRQVVKITVVGLGAANETGCGDDLKQTCVDTVTGGPVFIAVGGGLAYGIGAFTFLGSLTANVGVPNVMLNLDATLAAGFRL